MIFGTGCPVVRLISTDTDIELKFSSIKPQFIDKRILENESPITGKRSWVTLFNHSEFELTVHLHAHENPIRYFNRLLILEDSEVYFKPNKFHIDGYPMEFIKGTSGELVPFRCTDFEPFYLDNIHHFDCLTLIFKSIIPVAYEPINEAGSGNYSGLWGNEWGILWT